MGGRHLLERREVIVRVLASREPREWETFLGSLAAEQGRRHSTFVDYIHANDRPVDELIGRGLEWAQVRGLLGVVVADENYVTGHVW